MFNTRKNLSSSSSSSPPPPPPPPPSSPIKKLLNIITHHFTFGSQSLLKLNSFLTPQPGRGQCTLMKVISFRLVLGTV
jgi:hypothetical protein